MINLQDTITAVANAGADNAYTHFMREDNDHSVWIQDSEQDDIQDDTLEKQLKQIADKLLSIFPDSDYGSIKIVPDKNKVKIHLFYK